MTSDVREFAAKFYAALNADAWGTIEPELFDEIATVPVDEWSTEAEWLALSIERALS